MRTAVYYRNDDIRIEERPIPRIGQGEILLKVVACGICGSDVMEWYRIKKAPRVLGHEVVGVIEEVGERVKSFKLRDRVFISHHVPCNTCLYCLRGEYTACKTLHSTNIDPGGFSEYVRVPAINVDRGVFPLPPEITYGEGVLVEPLACVLRGLQKMGINPGETMLVLGSGVSGILHIQAARSFGASFIMATDVNEYRLQAAQAFGADASVHASQDLPAVLREKNDGKLAERVVVSTAAPSAIKQAFKCVDDAGSILFFAPTPPGLKFDFDLNDTWNRQLTITTSYAASPHDLEVAINLIKAERINVNNMITHKLGLDETQLGFKIVSQAKQSLKVVIEPHRSLKP